MEEIDSAHLEGIEIMPMVAPKEILRDEAGKLTGVLCQQMVLGDYDKSGRRRPVAGRNPDFVVACDQVIAAIGQSLDADEMLGGSSLEMRNGWIKIDRATGATSLDWVFAGGDAATGPASVVEAIAAGEKAAVAIDERLSGANHAFWRRDVEVDYYFDPDADPCDTPRAVVGCVDPAVRTCSFVEVELPWDMDVALAEAHRCLRCDYGKVPATAETKEI